MITSKSELRALDLGGSVLAGLGHVLLSSQKYGGRCYVVPCDGSVGVGGGWGQKEPSSTGPKLGWQGGRPEVSQTSLPLIDGDGTRWAQLHLNLLLVVAFGPLVCLGRPESSLGQFLGPVLPTTGSQSLASCPRLSVYSLPVY